MTDKAFSDLTSASALNDADIFAITQSGTSKKIASSVVKTYMQEGFTPTSTTTLTNKTVNLTNNTLTGTIAQFNSALSDADFCTIAGSETITNKTLTTPILSATVSGTTSGRLGYLSGALSYGDGTNQQTVATLDRTQTFTAAQSFSGNVTLGDASGDTVTLNSGTVTLNNSTTISAASTKTLTLNGGAGSNGLVIDASNNVGIGTSSPGYKLDVNGNISFAQTVNAQSLIVGNLSNTTYGKIVMGRGSYFVGGLTTGFTFNDSTDTKNLFTISNAAPNGAMTLDASGNLGLGVTPSANCGGRSLNVGNSGTGLFAAVSLGGSGGDYGGVGYNLGWQTTTGQYKYLQTDASSWIQFASGGFKFFTAPSGTAGNAISFNQAMTLDASGNLLVGDTSGTGQRIYAKSATTDGTTYATVLRNSASTLLLYVRSDGYISTGTAAASPYNNTSGSAANLYVDADGLLYRSTSSARYKNSIADAVHGLAEVLKLRPVTFKGNNDGDIVFGGLIAEEVHDAGLTEFVQYNDDGEPDALAYGNMVSLAFKAIQELHAEIETLKQKVNA